MTGFFLGRAANHAPGEALSGFRYVDAGIGDETAQPGLKSVSGIPKNVRLRDGVERGDFALATPKLKAARTSACGLPRFGNTLLIWLVQRHNGIGWLTGGFSLGAFHSP